MTTIETTAAPTGILVRVYHGLERFMGMLSSAYAMDHRYDEVLRLQAKTDDELAALGLTRDRIAAHVFRDMYYV
ncbi:MAG: hypothetical protein AAFN59_14035 [Pseudomonadota bacterium]